MRQVEFVPFRLTNVAEIFSIKIDGNEIYRIAGIVENGVKESFFGRRRWNKDNED